MCLSFRINSLDFLIFSFIFSLAVSGWFWCGFFLGWCSSWSRAFFCFCFLGEGSSSGFYSCLLGDLATFAFEHSLFHLHCQCLWWNLPQQLVHFLEALRGWHLTQTRESIDWFQFCVAPSTHHSSSVVSLNAMKVGHKGGHWRFWFCGFGYFFGQFFGFGVKRLRFFGSGACFSKDLVNYRAQ